jgi:hypothetical protein
MASLRAITEMEAAAQARLSSMLGVEPVPLHGRPAHGDPRLQNAVFITRIADAVATLLADSEDDAEDAPIATPKRGRPKKSDK